MKKWMGILLALSVGLNLGLLYGHLGFSDPWIAAPLPPGPEGHPPLPPQQMIEQQMRVIDRHLELDDGQEPAVRAILENRLPPMARWRREAAQANRSLAQVYAADPFDAVAFKRLSAEARLARSRADSVSALILFEKAAVLDPRQRRLFAEQGPLAENQRPPHSPAGAREHRSDIRP